MRLMSMSIQFDMMMRIHFRNPIIFASSAAGFHQLSCEFG